MEQPYRPPWTIGPCTTLTGHTPNTATAYRDSRDLILVGPAGLAGGH
jgi:hypothetical protein